MALNKLRKVSRFILVLSIMMSLCAGALCQGRTLDSLLKRLPNLSDSAKIRDLITISKAYESVDTAKASMYCNQADSIADRIKNDVLKASVLELRGALRSRYSIPDALFYYNKAIQLLDNYPKDPLANRVKTSIQNNIGVTYYLNGDFEGAVKYFISACEGYERSNPGDMNLGLTYANVATTFGDLKKYKEAIVYAKKALNFSKQTQDTYSILSAFHSLGDLQIADGDTTNGLANLDTARTLATNSKNLYYLFMGDRSKARYHFNLGQHQKAIALFRQSIEHIEKLDIHYDKATVYLQLGRSLMETGNTAEAYTEAIKGKRLADQNQFTAVQKDAFVLLSDLEKKKQNWKNAIAFSDSANILADSIYQQENLKRIDFLQAKYQADKQEATINSLQVQNQLRTTELDKRRNYIFLLAAIGIILSLLAIVFYRGNSLKKQKIQQLEKEQQLTAAEAVLRGQEQERGRLAKDLHDSLGGMLSGIKHSFTHMKETLIMTPENLKAFERGLEMLDVSINEFRQVAHNMMPDTLVKYGLNAAIRDYCAGFNSSDKFKITYQSYNIDPLEINQTTSITIYRVIQELVNNIIKHASATEAVVQVTREDNKLLITVEDNGKGFDPADLTAKKGIGWSNINNRIEYLKGKIDIDSKPGKGTAVNIEINI